MRYKVKFLKLPIKWQSQLLFYGKVDCVNMKTTTQRSKLYNEAQKSSK